MDYEYQPWGICLQRPSERLLLQTPAAQDFLDRPQLVLCGLLYLLPRNPPSSPPVIPQTPTFGGDWFVRRSLPQIPTILRPWPITHPPFQSSLPVRRRSCTRSAGGFVHTGPFAAAGGQRQHRWLPNQTHRREAGTQQRRCPTLCALLLAISLPPPRLHERACIAPRLCPRARNRPSRRLSIGTPNLTGLL